MIDSSSNLAIAIGAPSLLQRVLGVLGVLAPVRRSELVTVVMLTVNLAAAADRPADPPGGGAPA